MAIYFAPSLASGRLLPLGPAHRRRPGRRRSQREDHGWGNDVVVGAPAVRACGNGGVLRIEGMLSAMLRMDRGYNPIC